MYAHVCLIIFFMLIYSRIDRRFINLGALVYTYLNNISVYIYDNFIEYSIVSLVYQRLLRCHNNMVRMDCDSRFYRVNCLTSSLNEIWDTMIALWTHKTNNRMHISIWLMMSSKCRMDTHFCWIGMEFNCNCLMS